MERACQCRFEVELGREGFELQIVDELSYDKDDDIRHDDEPEPDPPREAFSFDAHYLPGDADFERRDGIEIALILSEDDFDQGDELIRGDIPDVLPKTIVDGDAAGHVYANSTENRERNEKVVKSEASGPVATPDSQAIQKEGNNEEKRRNADKLSWRRLSDHLLR